MDDSFGVGNRNDAGGLQAGMEACARDGLNIFVNTWESWSSQAFRTLPHHHQAQLLSWGSPCWICSTSFGVISGLELGTDWSTGGVNARCCDGLSKREKNIFSPSSSAMLECVAVLVWCYGLLGVAWPQRSSRGSDLEKPGWVSLQQQSRFRMRCIPSLPVWTLSGPGFQSPAAGRVLPQARWWWSWQVRLRCFSEVCMQRLGAGISGLTGLNVAAVWLCMHV